MIVTIQEPATNVTVVEENITIDAGGETSVVEVNSYTADALFLRGRLISNATPQEGQAFSFVGGQWTPTNFSGLSREVADTLYVPLGSDTYLPRTGGTVSGGVTIGNTAVAPVNTVVLGISHSFSAVAAPTRGVEVITKLASTTGTDSQIHQAVYGELYVDAAQTATHSTLTAGSFVADHRGQSTSTASMTGVGASSQILSDTGSVANLYGGSFSALAQKGGITASATGILATVLTASTLAGVPIARSILTNMMLSGPATAAYGVHVAAATGAGAIGTLRGIYVENMNRVGTDSMNLLSAGSDSRNKFEGLVGIGSADPLAPLHVTGTTLLNGNVMIGSTTAPAQALEVVGNVIVTGLGMFTRTLNDATVGFGETYVYGLQSHVDTAATHATSHNPGLYAGHFKATSRGTGLSYNSYGVHAEGIINHADGAAYHTYYATGGLFEGRVEGAAKTLQVQGVQATGRSDSTTKQNWVKGLTASANVGGGGAATVYHVHIPATGGTGAIDTLYGMLIYDTSARANVTSAYNLHSTGVNSRNWFEGRVGVGATPDATANLYVSGVTKLAGMVEATQTGMAVASGATIYGENLTLKTVMGVTAAGSLVGGNMTVESDATDTGTYQTLSGHFVSVAHRSSGKGDIIAGARYNTYSYGRSGSVWAVSGQASNFGSIVANMTEELIAIRGFVFSSTASDTTVAAAVSAQVALHGTGTTADSYGVRVQAPAGTAPATRAYGIHIADQTRAQSVTAYNFYSAGTGAKNLIEGDLIVPTISSSADLTLRVAASANAVRVYPSVAGQQTNFALTANNTDSAHLSFEAAPGDARYKFEYAGTNLIFSSPFAAKEFFRAERDSGKVTFANAVTIAGAGEFVFQHNGVWGGPRARFLQSGTGGVVPMETMGFRSINHVVEGLITASGFSFAGVHGDGRYRMSHFIERSDSTSAAVQIVEARENIVGFGPGAFDVGGGIMAAFGVTNGTLVLPHVLTIGGRHDSGNHHGVYVATPDGAYNGYGAPDVTDIGTFVSDGNTWSATRLRSTLRLTGRTVELRGDSSTGTFGAGQNNYGTVGLRVNSDATVDVPVGLVLTAPNATRYRLTVNNDGSLSTELLP